MSESRLSDEQIDELHCDHVRIVGDQVVGLHAFARAVERALAAQEAQPAEPSGYEATTPAYVRYVSPARYAKFSPEVQRWYRPYWTPQPAEQAAQPVAPNVRGEGGPNSAAAA